MNRMSYSGEKVVGLGMRDGDGVVKRQMVSTLTGSGGCNFESSQRWMSAVFVVINVIIECVRHSARVIAGLRHRNFGFVVIFEASLPCRRCGF